MIYTQSNSIDSNFDLIIPFKKGLVNQDQIVKLTGITNPVFDGDFGEIKLLYGPESRRIYLLGLGESKDENQSIQAFRKVVSKTRKHWSEKIQIDCSHLNDTQIVQAVTGIEMARYHIGAFKSEVKEDTENEILFCAASDLSAPIHEGKLIGETINRIKSLVDAPSNQKTPEYLAKWSEKSAQDSDYQCKIWDKEALDAEGFGAVLAVGKGSIHPPYLIQVSHLPKKGEAIDIGLAGKGITFDTGGLSIKAAQNLHYMKSDMGGAAVVLGVVELAARLKLNVNIVGVVAAAENAVDANSFRPGDVINSYSGKTIEIIDTDAEGRLVLADALNYIIKKHNPEQIIDLATLTGSVVRTLGYSAAGMFTKNLEIAGKLSDIGQMVHERVWPLPLYDDFESDLKSDIADIKNFSSKPIAGGIVAAKFLESFTEEHKKWVHLDIAGMAFGDSEYANMKCASGYGIRLMLEYIKSLQ